jgi:hypothetical protein
MTGFKSKKAAALDEDGMYFVHQTDHSEDNLHMVAQPAQEPVAWMYDWLCDGKLITGWIAHSDSEIPQLVASNIRPLYTAPPQRPWVDLTGNEWFEWWRVSKVADETEAEIDFADFFIIAQAVIAKLKEDNK